jgi:hypothetical protein
LEREVLWLGQDFHRKVEDIGKVDGELWQVSDLELLETMTQIQRQFPSCKSKRASSSGTYSSTLLCLIFYLVMAEILRSFLYSPPDPVPTFQASANHSFSPSKSSNVESNSTDSTPPSRPPPKKIPKGVVLGADGKPSDSLDLYISDLFLEG